LSLQNIDQNDAACNCKTCLWCWLCNVKN